VPFAKWLRKYAPEQNFVFTASERSASEAAVRVGVGIGFIGAFRKQAEPDLVEVWSGEEEWKTSLWLVTHVDLHRTPKVQAILQAMKFGVRKWQLG